MFAFIADVHVGNHKRHGGPVIAGINTRCRNVLSALRKAVQVAEEQEAGNFIVAGDLIDVTQPEAQILAAIQQAVSAGTFVTHFLRGNHDMVSTADGDNALAPLAPVGTVVEVPTIVKRGGGVEVFLVPFVPGSATEEIVRAVEALEAKTEGARGPRALVFHAGVRDAETPPWLREASDAIDVDRVMRLAHEHCFELVVAGNWHDGKVWSEKGVTVMQVGALAPTGWDNPGLDGYGGVVLWEPGKSLDRIEVPGPRFVKAAGVAEAARLMEIARRKGHQLYVEVSAEPEAVLATHAELDAAAQKTGATAVFDVVPDRSLAKVEARRAADAARSATTLEEALAGFVGRMSLPEGVAEQVVLERAKEYLRRAV
jgi:DNA repair exonuclease SbcCD nuclease subunit